MPDIRRCAIYGCKSNSRDNKTLKFFNFPSRDNPLYEIWLSICHESTESIRMLRRPYICSKHFHGKDVGFRRLATGAVPALYLTAPPGFADEEMARIAELEAAQAEKKRQVQLVNDTVFEWCKRAQHYPETAALCVARRELLKIATRVRNLLGATLTLNADDYWLRKFRRSHMFQLDLFDLSESRNKTLDLPSIINELDPTATILTEEEIEVLVKEEEAKLIEIELNRRQSKNKKKEPEDSPTCESPKNGSKTNKKAFANYYGQQRDYTTNGSLSSGSRFDVSEIDNSIDLVHGDYSGCASSDDDAEPDVRSEPIIDSYKQALEHLKPLEDFALRQENFRAIGLLSTLEIIFKSPK